jgi:hypothetical protein
LSVSSSRVGINLRAIVIIIASSWAGNLITLKGLSNSSKPSVRAIGEVVRVKIELPDTRNISLRAIKIACLSPSLVTVIFQTLNRTVPPVLKNRLSTKVMMIIKSRGLRPFNTYLRGILDRKMVRSKKLRINK